MLEARQELVPGLLAGPSHGIALGHILARRGALFGDPVVLRDRLCSGNELALLW